MKDRVVLTADDGMVYTNGIDYAYDVFLEVGADPSAYYQITEEEYFAAMAAKEIKEEESYGN